MSASHTINPWRVLLPVGLGTTLSLLGDTSLYTVLPIHTADAGVTVGVVGILLSANRWIRLLLNGAAGLIYERQPRRRLFVSALFVGALSTAIYALTVGFWPLLLGRLLWGVAWVGIWIGGNTMMLDITTAENRGRWVGWYQLFFFLGAASGALLGGIATEALGYRTAMFVNTGLTLSGALLALVFLPETRKATAVPAPTALRESASLAAAPGGAPPHQYRYEFPAAVALLSVNRFVVVGLFIPTFGLYLVGRFGDFVALGERAIGMTALTGVLLSLNAVLAALSSPLAGRVSDRWRSRWLVAALALAAGAAGFLAFVYGNAAFVLFGLVLVAFSGAGNQSMATALAGDLGRAGSHGRRLGWLFTAGDLSSALAPLVAFALLPFAGVRGVYLLGAAVLTLMLLAAAFSHYQSRRAAQVAQLV